MARPLHMSRDPNTGPSVIRSLTYQKENPSPKRSRVVPDTLKLSCTSQFLVLHGTWTQVVKMYFYLICFDITLFHIAPCWDLSLLVSLT